jgi:hypothetical protein
MSDTFIDYEEFTEYMNEVLFEDEVEEKMSFIPDGFHVEFHSTPAVEKKNLFFSPKLTTEENALLNLEVDDQIEDILYAAAVEKGSIPVSEPLVEEEIDDTYDPKIVDYEVDHERRLAEAIDALDEYFNLSQALDQACDRLGWSELSAAKDMAWSIFKEEMDTNYMALDKFDTKADKRLTALAAQGEEPKPEQWNKFLTVRSKLLRQAKATEQRRFDYTHKFYDRARGLNAECKRFWKSENGKVINGLIAQRRQLYADLVKNDQWKYVAEYWKLRNEEISRSYLSTNDNAGVDDPDEAIHLRDTAECLGDTHMIEEYKLRRDDDRVSRWYSKFLDKQLEKARRADASIREYL